MPSKPHTLEYQGDPKALAKLWADTDDMLAILFRLVNRLLTITTTAGSGSGSGATGPAGPPGVDGAEGSDGAQGPPGVAGATGATGVANMAIVMQRVVLGI